MSSFQRIRWILPLKHTPKLTNAHQLHHHYPGTCCYIITHQQESNNCSPSSGPCPFQSSPNTEIIVTILKYKQNPFHLLLKIFQRPLVSLRVKTQESFLEPILVAEVPLPPHHVTSLHLPNPTHSTPLMLAPAKFVEHPSMFSPHFELGDYSVWKIFSHITQTHPLSFLGHK